MKNILISIKPKYVSMILNKTKTIEVRKRFPKEYRGWVYIYCTKNGDRPIYLPWEFNCHKENGEYIADCEFKKGNGKVVARFYCDNVEEIYDIKDITPYEFECECDRYVSKTISLSPSEFIEKTCLTQTELDEYLDCGEKTGYAVHISQLEIFDKPKELSEFYKIGHYEDFNDYFTDEKRINGKWCIPLKKAPQSMMYIEVEE